MNCWSRLWPERVYSRSQLLDQVWGRPERLPRLTERFYRVAAGRSRQRGGTGLGLAIVEHVLQRHGAELQIVSKFGEVSHFSCHFPRARLITPSQEPRI